MCRCQTGVSGDQARSEAAAEYDTLKGKVAALEGKALFAEVSLALDTVRAQCFQAHHASLDSILQMAADCC